jgi:hypothetical protein
VAEADLHLRRNGAKRMPITRLYLQSKILKDANRPAIIVFELIFLARVTSVQTLQDV